MNKDQILALAAATDEQYVKYSGADVAERWSIDFAAALTEPLEKDILMYAAASKSRLRDLDNALTRIAELEVEIAHWHNVIIKEVAAQSIVPKVPMTAKELIVLLEKHHGYGSAWAAFARDVEAHHGIGVKV